MNKFKDKDNRHKSTVRLKAVKTEYMQGQLDIRGSMRNANMQKELSLVLVRLGLVKQSITRVTISVDWRYATIYCISNLDLEDEKAASELFHARQEISKILKERASGHFFPKLRFKADVQARKEEHLLSLLDSIPDAEDEAINDSE